MPPNRRLTLALAAVAALAAASGPAAAGCRLNPDRSCARPGATCPVDGRGGFCRNYRHRYFGKVQVSCICATPIVHGGGSGHRK
jgi:hypothetical protein